MCKIVLFITMTLELQATCNRADGAVYIKLEPEMKTRSQSNSEYIFIYLFIYSNQMKLSPNAT